MTSSKLLPPLLIVEDFSSAWAVGQVVPSSTIFYVTADEALRSKLSSDTTKRGYIAAGTDSSTPPTTFFQEDNKTLVGRETNMMNAAAARLGVEARWQDTGGFDNIIPGLKSDRYDVILSNTNAIKKHLEQVDFISYCDVSRPGVISRRDANIAPFTSFEAVCGWEVGVGTGTTQIGRLEAVSRIYTDAGKPPIKTAVFLDRPSDIQAVVSGRVPMFLGLYEGLTYQVSQVEPLTLTGTIHVDDASVSVAFPRQSGLEEAVQASLNSLIKDGTYQRTPDKWPIGFGAVRESKHNGEILG